MSPPNVIAIPEGARPAYGLCPFSSIPVQVRDPQGNTVVGLNRAECTSECALFDRKQKLPCIPAFQAMISARLDAIARSGAT